MPSVGSSKNVNPRHVEAARGGDSNSRPTPNAFGAALLRLILASKPLQMINRKLRTLFRLQCALNAPCVFKCWHLLACDDFDSVAKPFGCMRVTSQVFRKSGVKLNSGADVMPSVGSSKNVNPRHVEAARGEIRTPDQGLMSPLLYH